MCNEALSSPPRPDPCGSFLQEEGLRHYPTKRKRGRYEVLTVSTFCDTKIKKKKKSKNEGGKKGGRKEQLNRAKTQLGRAHAKAKGGM